MMHDYDELVFGAVIVIFIFGTVVLLTFPISIPLLIYLDCKNKKNMSELNKSKPEPAPVNKPDVRFKFRKDTSVAK